MDQKPKENTVSYAQPNKLKNKDKHQDQIYANLPGVKREERELEITETPRRPDVLQVKTQAPTSESCHQRTKLCKQTKNGVAIECQRLNRNKVLEKINVEVSAEVFEALQQMNPNLTMKNTTKKTWNILDVDSADFCLGKSLRDVKALLEWARSWKAGVKARYNFSKQKVTSL